MFDSENEFEKILAKTTEARHQKISLEEHADSLVKVLGIKINGILEQYGPDILALDENLRGRIKENLKQELEQSFKKIEELLRETEL